MQKLVLAALAALAFTLPVAAADISGTWSVSGEIVGNQVNMKCTFAQADGKLTGTCAGEVGSTQTTGTVTENKVSFMHTVDRGQVYELNYNGTLDAAGTSMQGEILVMGVAGTFTAKKDAAAPAAAASASSAGFGGNWSINGDVVGNVIDMKCAFKTDGDKFAGTCTYAGLGTSPTTGSVSGKTVTFQNQVQREELYSLTFTGTLDDAGSSVKGDIAVAGVTGTFAGTKDK